MTIRKHVKLGLSALALSMSLNAAAAEDPIKVGILHSLSGTMAISETVLKDTVEMLIAKQNAEGGVLGRELEAVVVDPASNWPLFAEKARELGLPVLAQIKSYGSAAVDPAIMGIGPVPASKKCLAKANWSIEDLDLIEANEAFAAQCLSVGKELAWDTDKVNVNGGAIALGHPIGASGCRILVTLLHEMVRRDSKKGLATLCIGGGQGVAMALERP